MSKLPVAGSTTGVSTNDQAIGSQVSNNGRFSFELGHIPAGKRFLLFMQFQVNPTNVAWRRPQNVELDDGNTVLAILHRTITVFP